MEAVRGRYDLVEAEFGEDAEAFPRFFDRFGAVVQLVEKMGVEVYHGAAL